MTLCGGCGFFGDVRGGFGVGNGKLTAAAAAGGMLKSIGKLFGFLLGEFFDQPSWRLVYSEPATQSAWVLEVQCRRVGEWGDASRVRVEKGHQVEVLLSLRHAHTQSWGPHQQRVLAAWVIEDDGFCFAMPFPETPRGLHETRQVAGLEQRQAATTGRGARAACAGEQRVCAGVRTRVLKRGRHACAAGKEYVALRPF